MTVKCVIFGQPCGACGQNASIRDQECYNVNHLNWTPPQILYASACSCEKTSQMVFKFVIRYSCLIKFLHHIFLELTTTRKEVLLVPTRNWHIHRTIEQRGLIVCDLVKYSMHLLFYILLHYSFRSIDAIS